MVAFHQDLTDFLERPSEGLARFLIIDFLLATLSLAFMSNSIIPRDHLLRQFFLSLAHHPFPPLILILCIFFFINNLPIIPIPIPISLHIFAPNGRPIRVLLPSSTNTNQAIRPRLVASIAH